jgi:hypothetical protein
MPVMENLALWSNIKEIRGLMQTTLLPVVPALIRVE